MNKLILMAACVLVASNAHATTTTVVEGELLQPHLDGTADTLYLPTWTFDEDVVIWRPVAVLPAPDFRTSAPVVRSLTLDMTNAASSWSAEVRGLRVLRATKVISGSRENHLTISACRLDGGLTANTPNGYGIGLLRVTYCTIFGDVDVHIDRTDFAMNTVLNGGINLVGGALGMSRVVASHVQGAPGTAISIRDDPHDAEIQGSTVTGAAHGLYLFKGGRAIGNVVTDVQGDGMLEAIDPHVSVTVDDNRFERCGRGIVIIGGNAGGSVDGNVVLNSVGDGIVTHGVVTRNTVVRSGGNGIVLVASSFNGAGASGNVVAFNAGFGITGQGSLGPCNLLWSNGIDARVAGNLYLDPQFCDLSAGDVRIAASSPAVGGPCGQIGALGVGCGSQAMASVSHGSHALAVRGRGSMALVTLASAEPAALEVLDVAGRRISRTMVTASGEVPIGRDLPAGLYFLRLTQGAARVSGKALVR
jgi:hypothetical protein